MANNLQNNLLIAMPGIKNPIFKRTVVYIFEHNQEGAMGIIINKPLKNLKIKNILQKLNINPSPCLFGPRIQDSVIMGGPQAQEKGFIIHSSKQPFYSSIRISEKTFITTSRDILESIATLEEPTNLLVALGYCTWDKQQLDKELLNNFWLIATANQKILFHTPIQQRWVQASKILGIDISQLSIYFGHA